MRHLILLSVLMLAACWAAAQNDSTQTTPAGSQAGEGSQTTVQGCLSGSEGSYTLMADNGTSYQLTGSSAKLKEHVGHEVKITGTASPSSGQASANMGGEAGGTGIPILQVESIKHVSKTCQKSGASH
jgi:ABC-type phosphate transport system substrate-binding protein